MDNKSVGGKLTLVTPPSMINPSGISFTLIDFDEKQKDIFSRAIDKSFPTEDITVYMYDNKNIDDEWYNMATQKSNYIIKSSENILDKIKVIKEQHVRQSSNL